jgi:hypothetical protein
LFHHFHQHWIVTLCDALNEGRLPPDCFALTEQSAEGPIPDVLPLHLALDVGRPSSSAPGLAVAQVPPRASLVARAEEDTYARRADRVTVRHKHGDVVAVIEVVSPGNKSSKSALQAFVAKPAALMRQGVHLMVIDLFPPTKRDPHGIHEAIWDEFVEEDFALRADRPLFVASYDAGPPVLAYAEACAVGGRLPEMPLFLSSGFYVPAPLEATYQTTWSVFPAPLKGLLDRPVSPPGPAV